MSTSLSKRLIVGAASFGNRYGLANEHIAQASEVREIIRAARSAGVLGFDTAPSYGNSEAYLGEESLAGFKVYTKSRPKARPNEIAESVLASISVLGVPSLSGFTFHDCPAFLASPREYASSARALIDEGFSTEWGVSVYEPDEIERILDYALPNYFQAPSNFLDARFQSERMSRLLQSSGVRLQVRSIFLQGLLLDLKAVPSMAQRWKVPLENVFRQIRELGFSPAEFSILYAINLAGAPELVVGVNSLDHLTELMETANRDMPLPTLDLSGFEGLEELVDPRKWRPV